MARPKLDSDGLRQNARKRILLCLLRAYWKNRPGVKRRELIRRSNRQAYVEALEDLFTKGLACQSETGVRLKDANALQVAFQLHDGQKVEI